ncbi:hypothetical protein P3T40_003373 [Paraburkholderia sp. EB58]|uniref:hypothetical protein n=1 Tax=Paraburkholderia sp. EB58 TaxID=3035125 RepID=UPI003D1C46CF
MQALARIFSALFPSTPRSGQDADDALSEEEKRAAELGYAAWHKGDRINPFPVGTPRHKAWQDEWDKFEWANTSSW